MHEMLKTEEYKFQPVSNLPVLQNVACMYDTPCILCVGQHSQDKGMDDVENCRDVFNDPTISGITNHHFRIKN